MHTEGKNILVIDIGSGSIGSAVVSIGKKNAITFANRYELEFGEKTDFKLLLDKVNLGIKHCLEKIPNKAIAEVHMFMHSPWHTVTTKKITLNEPKDFKITEDLIEQASQNEIVDFMANARANFPGFEDLMIIESTVPEIKINGYIVDKPFGKKVKACEFLMSLALAPKDIIHNITNICESVLKINKKDIKFHSATTAFTHLCSSLYNENNAIMIIDVGSEITDISLVKNKALSFGVSFVGGSHDIIRKISQLYKTNFTDSESLAFAAFSGVGAQDKTLQMETELGPLCTVWQKSISDSLVKISKFEAVPKKIILICEDSNTASWYAKSISSDTFTQYLRTEGKFQTITPSIEALKAYINMDNVSYIDTSLCLLCITV